VSARRSCTECGRKLGEFSATPGDLCRPCFRKPKLRAAPDTDLKVGMRVVAILSPFHTSRTRRIPGNLTRITPTGRATIVDDEGVEHHTLIENISRAA